VNIILLCLYLFYAAAVLLLCCFRAMINHHLQLSSGSTISKQDPDDCLVIQIVWLLLHNLPWTDCFWAYVCMDAKGYGNPDGVSFWLGLHFLRPAQFFAELVHPTRETSCDPATPAQLCGTSCKHPPSIALLVIFLHGPFINLNVSLMLACLGTPDLITVLFFSVSWQTIYCENANAIFSLSPINLLLLLVCFDNEINTIIYSK